MKRPSAKCCDGIYSILDNFCYAVFLACYTFEIKSSKTSEYQLHELDDNLIENNHEEVYYPSEVKMRKNTPSKTKANPLISPAK